MKKSALLIGLMIVLADVSAQIVKEHAFDDQTSISMQVIRLENSGQKICVVNRPDSITYECIFYNLDYTEYKTITIDLEPLFFVPAFNSPQLVVRYVSENVFDLDNDIELLCQLTYSDNNYDEYAEVVVFNDNGTPLFESDIENSNAWLMNSSIANGAVIPSLASTSEGTKLILDVFYFGLNQYSFDVYDLPGSLPSSQNQGVLGELPGGYLRAFPVPAHDYVNLDYKLAGDQSSGEIEILDEQGKTLQRIRVEKNQGMIRVPVTNYNNGIYIYKLNTRRGVPRTGKVMIVK
jgi:hypothetical protein